MGNAVSRHLLRLSIPLALACQPWPGAQAAPPLPDGAPAAVSFAEQPARLVRGTALYRAGRGVALQDRDMLESGGGATQLLAGGSTLALGPGSRIVVGKGSELVLLEGWMKLACQDAPGLAVRTSALQVDCAGATLALRVQGPATELFTESGTVQVAERRTGKRQRAIRLAQEQFAARSGAQPLRVAERPPAAFIAAMPRSFRDELVPLAAGSPGAPRRERSATVAELLPWVAGHPDLRQQLQHRFDPPRFARPSSTRHRGEQ